MEEKIIAVPGINVHCNFVEKVNGLSLELERIHLYSFYLCIANL